MTLRKGFFRLLLLSGIFVSGCVPRVSHNLNIPSAINTINGKDGTIWEEVSLPGFGNRNNIAVVSMAEYQGSLYALTRNDVEGAEIWRTRGDTWEKVIFPEGKENGIYGNKLINNLFADMIVYKGKLYLGFSSGFQGSARNSSGCEIWRYDGNTWEPVISDKKDVDEAGKITSISGCSDKDGEIVAFITDDSKNWEPNQWAGGVLQITSGEGKYRRFDIISNTRNTLTIQQNELAGNTGTEYTICDRVHYTNPFPPYEYELGRVEVGDSYEIGMGHDENGFGDYWNRAINCMVIYKNRLYVSTGLNYEYGAEVWFTEDGDHWEVTTPRHSFALFHMDPTYPQGKKPVTVTILSMCPFSVSGVEALYAGGTGSTGSAGACARMAKLKDREWELIVDANVDENDTGTNENGFGDGMKCTMFNGNFMPWSLATFKGGLYVGINSVGGARVLYTLNGSSEDGSWFYSVGGNSRIPNGFDGLINEGTFAFTGKRFFKNIVANLFAYQDYLYAGLTSSYVPTLGATEEYLTGAQIWKTSDGLNWEQITDNGFGDRYIINFESFTLFKGNLYVSGSKGANSLPGGLGGAKIFRLIHEGK